MNADQKSSESCEVLVIGAGPTGLMAAYLLKRSGVDVRIVDENPEATRESRAGAMSSRSVELFASLDLTDRLFAQGVINTNVDFFVSGKPVGGLQYEHAHVPDTPFPFMFMIPQSKTEHVLLSALKDVHVEVERNVKVVSLEQNTDSVRVAAKRTAGESLSIQARFVIGADGAHSVVRHELGLQFEGSQYPQTFLLGDVEVEWPMDHERFRVFIHGERIGLFVPLGRSHHSRVMTTDMRPVTGEESASALPLTLEQLQSAFRDVACLPVMLKNPDWLTRFRTNHREVERFRVGRVFVAGDAAHIHSPAGGQGMNTGLQDAANLAWKLAAVLRSRADESLLNTYEAERLPVAKEVLRFTDDMFTTVAGQTGWRAKLRDVLAPVVVGSAAGLEFVQSAALRKFGQLDISYAANPFVAAAGHDSHAKVGGRAPNAQLSRHRDLFDLLTGYRFHILALSRKRLNEGHVSDAFQNLQKLDNSMVSTHLLARVTAVTTADVIPLERAEVFERYGLATDEAQALLIVRPDGYIAWRAETLDWGACGLFLQRMVRGKTA